MRSWHKGVHDIVVQRPEDKITNSKKRHINRPTISLRDILIRKRAAISKLHNKKKQRENNVHSQSTASNYIALYSLSPSEKVA